MEVQRKKGFYTFRITAVLILISAVFELFAVTSEAPLFGAVRGGMVVAVYHLVYVALFTALGLGLWQGRTWGYTLVFVTAGVYTLDKAQLVLARNALEEYLRGMMAGLDPALVAAGMDVALMAQAVALMSVVAVLGWWGFALYAYWRREYFQPGA